MAAIFVCFSTGVSEAPTDQAGPAGHDGIETPIINPKSRDDIEAVLRGLQHRYVSHWSELEVIFGEEFCPDVDRGHGRPGMNVGSILVAGD